VLDLGLLNALRLVAMRSAAGRRDDLRARISAARDVVLVHRERVDAAEALGALLQADPRRE